MARTSKPGAGAIAGVIGSAHTPATKRAETKAERFRRVALSRMDRALKALELVGGLAGTGYESTAEQQVAMFEALLATLEVARSRFEPKPVKFSFAAEVPPEPPQTAA